MTRSLTISAPPTLQMAPYPGASQDWRQRLDHTPPRPTVVKRRKRQYDAPPRKRSRLWLLVAPLPIVLMNYAMNDISASESGPEISFESTNTSINAPEHALKPND